MREVTLHRRAKAAMRKMPLARAEQIAAALREVAELPDVATHQNIRHMTGMKGWFRLRVGSYRAILQPRENGEIELLYVDWVGPRGDAYR